MKDEVSMLGVHQPVARMAFILDLVVGAKMPFTRPLLAPEGVVWQCIGGLDPSRVIGAAVCGDPPILDLNILSSDALVDWRRRGCRGCCQGDSVTVHDGV